MNIDYETGLPEHMTKLHRDAHGRPVPWFVEWIGGKPDFRIADARKLQSAILNGLCWACGQQMGAYRAFVIGPMCAVNRNTAEPPCHRDCAIYCATHCDFLVNPKRGRRALNEDLASQAAEMPGEPLMRNPGVTLVWICKASSYRIIRSNDGVLFRLGEATETLWYAEGREATREEVLHSIKTGLPVLEEIAASEGPEATEQLAKMVHKAFELVPK